ncbi:uncharacterized protein LOC127579399 isoform X2 [Pristis pectinata]|uniref:uncharacterized protein LOC127579399 isoform X2 n=1 Tax=Pristis pectinata TaxID=685728 RepID=UPI00223D4098|nr:uncharacterized protein LOC127579399 isoform X2 [Pristis pectinata]
MATWVEGKPIPPQKNTLSDVNNIVSETKTPWSHVSPLSDASNKALESTTPTSHIFDDGKLNYNLGSVTKTLIAPKPRVSPRPFSAEKSSVPFSSLGITQAPEPKSATPSGKLPIATGDEEANFRRTEATQAPTGAASSVLSSAPSSSLGSDGISSIGTGDSQDDANVINLPSTPKLYNVAASSSNAVLSLERMTEEERDCSKAKPTTLVILETSTQTLKSKKSSEEDQKAGKWTSRDSSQDQEMQRTTRPFTLPKPSIQLRKCSPSATEGIGTSNPTLLSLDPLGKWDLTAEEDKDKTDKEKDVVETPLSRRTYVRKSRPLSAWLSGATNDQKSETTVKHDENAPTPEKPWLKKPRPLSMDLTARFEPARSTVYKRNSCLSEESKENVPILQAAGALFSGTEHKTPVQPEESAAEREQSRSPNSPDDCENRGSGYFVVKEMFNSIPKTDVSKKDVNTVRLYETDNKEETSSSESKILWQNDYNNTSKTIAGPRKEEKEERTFTTSLKNKKEKSESDQDQHKNLTDRELDKNCSNLEPASNDENSCLGLDERGRKGSRTPVSGGIIRRRISLLLDSASISTAKADSPQTTVEKEKINIRVKQQIQSFTSENKEQIQSSQRRLFQPRPLSSDITKLFETRGVGDEGRFEKQVDMTVFSSPERSNLQNTQEQRGRESLAKGKEVERDPAEKGRLHLMEADTEFSWSRHRSMKKVSKGLDKGTTDEKTCSEKISRRNSFARKKEMKAQVNETIAPDSVASLSKTGSQSSDGQKSVSEPLDSDSLVKSLRVFVIENEIQRHKVPDLVELNGSSDSVNPCFDKEKRPEQNSQYRLKSYTAMKAAVDVMYSEQETKKTKSLQLETTSLEGKEKTCFETEERSDSGRSSSKIVEQNVSSLLLSASDGEVDILQKVSEKTASSSLPATSEDKVETQSMRKSHIMADQVKLEEKVCSLRRRWNQPHPTEIISSLETPSTAPNSKIKGVEMLKAVQIQQSHEKVLNSAILGSDIVEKKQVKVTRHSSFSNSDAVGSKGSSRYFDLRKYDDSATRELLPSAGSKDVKDPKSKDDAEAGKESKHWFEDDTALEFCWKAIPKAGWNEKSKVVSSGANSAADQVSDSSTDASYQKHRYVSADRKLDGLFEEYSKGYSKISTTEKPKSTLLSEEFLSRPWSSRMDNAEETHATPTVKKSKMADIEKSRKTRSSLQRKSHSVLDLDVLMAEYRKESSERKIDKESKIFHYDNKKDNHLSKTLQKDYEEHRTPKLTKSADTELGKSSPSGKRKGTSDKHNKKALHHNILDLDALMADYSKEPSRPADILQKTSGSKPISGIFPGVKIENPLSPFSEEVKTSWRNDQIKKCHDAEFKRDVYDGTCTDLKRRSKEEKKSRPSSVYNEYEELRKNEVCSTSQKSEGERSREMDGDTSSVANVIRRHKHEKRKSRPSSAYTGYSELQWSELLADGQKTDAGRDRGKSRKDDQRELMPSHRKDWSEEARFVTPVEMDCSNRTLEGHYMDAKTSILDDLASSRRPLYGSSYVVLEKEKYIEMSVDDVQHVKVESRPIGRGEHSGQNSPRIARDHPKEPQHSLSEVKKSRPFEIHKKTQKAVDGLLMNQEGTSADHKNHGGRRSYSTDRVQSRGTEISKHGLSSIVDVKKDSQPVEKGQNVDFQKSTRWKIGDMIQLPLKAKKQDEKKTYSRREVQQGNCQVHKADRVKQCCVSPTLKAKDTDALVQEKDQFCTCEDKEQYGTYEEREYSTSEEAEPYSKYNDPKDYEDTICRAVSPCKDRTADPVVCPRGMSLSSHSGVTPAGEQPCSFQEPRSTSHGLSSCELESTDDTDSSQSTGPVAQDDQTPQGFSFLEPVTTLDSCAQKSRIQLGRKTFRRAPTKHRKGGLGDQSDGTDQLLERNMEPYMYKDSTEPRLFEHEESTTQEVKGCEKLPVSSCQKVAMFPGMDPAVLKASLRRSRPEVEVADELNSKSCKLPPQQGFRVLPPATGKGEGSDVAIPSWLQELKSKKRLSQFQPSETNE